MTWTTYVNFRSPFPRRLHIKFALIGQAISEEKMFENCGRTTDGRRLDGYTISSLCEPNGSGDLKRGANSVASDHEAVSNHLSGLPLIAFTNWHHHHQCENAQISCTITTLTLLLLHRYHANQEGGGNSSDLPSIFQG